MKLVRILLIACLLFASTDAQSLRRRIKKKKATKKVKLKKIAQAPLKNGGGTFKMYQAPDGTIVAATKYKGGGDSSDESSRADAVTAAFSKLEKKKKTPSPEQVWKVATGKKVPKKLKAATRRRLESQSNSDSDSKSLEKKQRKTAKKEADAPVANNCPTFFWNTNDCSATAKNLCICQKTGDARFNRVTDYLHTTVYPYRGTLVHAQYIGNRLLGSQAVRQNTYGLLWAWLDVAGEAAFNARLLAAAGDNWHFSIKWGS